MKRSFFVISGLLCLAFLSGVITRQFQTAQITSKEPTSTASALNAIPPGNDSISRSDQSQLPTSNDASSGQIDLAAGLIAIPGRSGTNAAPVPLSVVDELKIARETRDISKSLDFARSAQGRAYASSVLLEAGKALYDAGSYSRSLETLEEAWGFAVQDQPSNWTEDKVVAGVAAALGGLYARLGRLEELKGVLRFMKGRPVEGSDTLAFTKLRQAVNSMEEFPEHSFKCGPLAIESVFTTLVPNQSVPSRIAEIESPRRGFSLAELEALSSEIGLPSRAFRADGARIPVPSVVHWRAGHYAAVVKHEAGSYLVEDPTFQRSIWMTEEAVREESSGLFLVPDQISSGHRLAEASKTEKESNFGRGAPSQSETDDQGGSQDEGPSCGMARASFNDFFASLVIKDTPLFYAPPVGPPVMAELTYFESSNFDNATASHGHPGKKWMLNWIRHIEVPTLTSTSGRFRVVRHNGKTETFTSAVNAGAQVSSRAGTDSLARLGIAGGVGGPITRMTRSLPDGSIETYGFVASGGNTQAFGAIVGNGGANSRFYLAEISDPQGNKLRFQYVAGTAKLKKVIDAIGQETTLYYSDAAGGVGTDNPNRRHISAIRDPFGRVAQFNYDAQLRLVRITDVAGIQSSFAYGRPDVPDFITSMTTPYGTSRFEKPEDPFETELTLTDPEGLPEKVLFEFSLINRTLAGVNGTSAVAAETPNTAGVTIANGQTHYGKLYYGVTLHWDKKTMRNFPPGEDGENYDKAHQTRWAQRTTSYTLLTGTPLNRRPALSHREWYLYQGQTNPGTLGTNSLPILRIRRVVNASGQPADEIHRYEYNSIGHPTRVTDPLGREITYTYASNGIDLLNIRRKRGASFETLATFSGHGTDAPFRPRYSTDAAGRQTQMRWNSRGQLTESIDPLNRRTVYTYDANGYLQTIQGTHPAQPANLVELRRFFYDTFGRVSRIRESDGYELTFDYDALDRVTRTTFPDGTTTTTTYVAMRPVATKDRRNRTTTFAYNRNQQLVTVTDPAGRSTQMEWCSCGGPKALIDPLGRRTEWQYDILGRTTLKRYHDGSEDVFEYEPSSGRLSRSSKARDSFRGFWTKTLSYNLDGQIARIDYTDAGTPDVTLNYDASDGRITSMVDGTGTTTYTYRTVDGTTLGAGQLWRIDGPLTADTITYSYDALGRRTAYTVDTAGETLTFDPLGRISQIVNPLGTFTQTYVGNTDRLNTVTYPGGMTAAYAYTPLAGDFRLREILHTRPGGAELSRHSYEYDAEGTMTRWTQVSASAGINRSWRLGHDLADQLVSVSAQDPGTLAARPTGNASYAYDAAGNRTLENRDGILATAAYDGLNRILNAGGTAPAPLLRGFEWDAEDRLIAITYPGTNRRTEFTYDGLGRRVAIIEKAGTTVQEHRRFMWDGLRIVEERGANGQATRRRYFTGGMQYASTAGGSLQARLFATDHLGSVRHVTNASGTWLGSVDYDPWGRRTVTTGSSDETALGFTGHPWHEASGLALAPYRAYDPAMGRWISRDPIGENGDLNLYRYVYNRPDQLIDPRGDIAFLPALFWAWGAIEAGLTAYDVYETVDTLSNPCSSDFAKGTSVLGLAAGFILPGGGYGTAAKTPLWTSTKGKTSVENAFGHWQKHGAEFPEFQNAKQYVEGTKSFFSNPPAGTLTKTRPNGDTLFYNQGSNTFGVQAADGAPRTLFRPSDGLNYWNKQ